jgi:hypothetical protein
LQHHLCLAAFARLSPRIASQLLFVTAIQLSNGDLACA